jgi:DinB superfamily
MNQDMNWINKEWTPVKGEVIFSELLDELELTPGKILELTKSNDSTMLTAKPIGKWSVHEHSGHLLTMESLWIARLDDYALGNPTLRPWNGHNQDTESAQFNRHRLGKIIEDLEDIRSAHVRMLRSYESRARSLVSRHERLQQDFRLIDHIHFMLEHDLHHLKAIEILLSQST